jgi:hypothetical protein
VFDLVVERSNVSVDDLLEFLVPVWAHAVVDIGIVVERVELNGIPKRVRMPLGRNESVALVVRVALGRCARGVDSELVAKPVVVGLFEPTR